MAVQRPSWVGKGNYYTPHGVQIRSVRKYASSSTSSPSPFRAQHGLLIRDSLSLSRYRDQSNQNMTLHYLSNGSCSLRISVFKQEYFIPGILILKVLSPRAAPFVLCTSLARRC